MKRMTAICCLLVGIASTGLAQNNVTTSFSYTGIGKKRRRDMRCGVLLILALLVLSAPRALCETIRTDVAPYESGRTVMVPMRAIFEWLGAEVTFDSGTGFVTAKRGEQVVSLKEGDRTAIINGEEKTMSVPAVSKSGRTFVPVRFIAESFGAEVSWDARTKEVTISSAGREGTLRVPQEADSHVEPLIAALKDEDSYVRRSAAMALGEIGDARAVEPLIAALKDEDSYVRSHAASALAKIGDARAVGPLIAALKDRDSIVRVSAAMELGEIGDARAVEPLIAALKDKDWFVRGYVAKALAKIGDARAVEPLIAALKDEYSYVRLSAAEALGEIGDARAVEPLIATLKDEHSWVRLLAAGTLGEIGDARAVGPLIAALKDEEWFVRLHAAEALGKIGSPAVEQLSAVLKDENSYIRRRAVEVLVKINNEQARGVLFGALSEGDLDVVATAYRFFISAGRSGTEDALILALSEHGTAQMATDYSNCGNSRLSSAAERWARTHDYNLTRMPEGSSGPRWGGK